MAVDVFRKITVGINQTQSMPSPRILQKQVVQGGGFPRPRLPQNIQMCQPILGGDAKRCGWSIPVKGLAEDTGMRSHARQYAGT